MTSEDRDRDMLIRVEQQLQNAHQNQMQILEDLRTIFNRLEQESKIVTVISGDLKGHLESSSVRWANMEKQLNEIDRRLMLTEDKLEQHADVIGNEREERIGVVTAEREARAKENKERETFEREIKASIRTISWVISALASIATVVSVVSIFVHR